MPVVAQLVGGGAWTGTQASPLCPPASPAAARRLEAEEVCHTHSALGRYWLPLWKTPLTNVYLEFRARENMKRPYINTPLASQAPGPRSPCLMDARPCSRICQKTGAWLKKK